MKFPAVDESTLKRKVDEEIKEDEKIPEKKCKTGDAEEKKNEEDGVEKPVAEPEAAVTEQEATA